MSLTKQYLKTKQLCKVTFRVPGQASGATRQASLVGDFNDWNPNIMPMQPLKTGGFKATLNLPVDQQYQFRYLFDGERWENDSEADGYVAAGVGDAENSVVTV